MIEIPRGIPIEISLRDARSSVRKKAGTDVRILPKIPEDQDSVRSVEIAHREIVRIDSRMIGIIKTETVEMEETGTEIRTADPGIEMTVVIMTEEIIPAFRHQL